MTSAGWREGRFEPEKCFVIEFHYFVRPNTPNIVILSNLFLLGVFQFLFFFIFLWQQLAIRLTQRSSPAGFDLANSILATNSRGCEFTLQYSKRKKSLSIFCLESSCTFPQIQPLSLENFCLIRPTLLSSYNRSSTIFFIDLI